MGRLTKATNFKIIFIRSTGRQVSVTITLRKSTHFKIIYSLQNLITCLNMSTCSGEFDNGILLLDRQAFPSSLMFFKGP